MQPCRTCNMGYSTYQIHWPSNGLMQNYYTFQSVGPLMDCPFSDLWAEGCCHSLNALFALVVGGYIGFTPSVRPSVRLSVRLSHLPCPLCDIYSFWWILSILATNDHYHERMCRTQWPLTLTYIFKVIRPWPWKSCPLCSIYNSWWILSIFDTNDH